MNANQIIQVTKNITDYMESIIGTEKLIDVGIPIKGSWIIKYEIQTISEGEDHIYVVVNIYTKNSRHGRFYFFTKETCEMMG